MRLHAIASSVALAAALSLTGPVAAQEFMLRGDQIPVDQVNNFKEACEGLRAANTASLTTNDDQSEIDPAQTGSIDDDDFDPGESSGSPDPASQDHWDELMATLTVEECEAAGFFVE